MKRNMSVPNRVSTLALAVALVAGPSQAVAQSFQGTVDAAVGATVDQSTPGQTNVSVTQQQAVINWTATNNPNSGVIIFQPEGTQATFTGSSNFAILNRVTPGTAGNAIFMGGNITSLVGESIGGTVYFYSPNGIIIGQNAVINVGSLGLTTLPIADDGQGNWMSGFGGSSPQVVFGQATDPNSYIRTNAVIDGSINAHGSGSYVALVAPSIHHQGLIRTDGAAALVAAEAATITFSPSGLFNIEVTTGTDAATGIHVDGGTITRNSATEGIYNHRAYLVAVAKNDAVTMLINNGGSVGFDTATSAIVENNVVVLSGGYDVLGGDHSTTSGVSEVPLTITSANFSSDVDAQVTGGAAINSGAGALTFGGDLSIIGGETTTTGGNVLIDGLNGNPLTIAGDLFARAFRRNADGSQTGLIARLSASGGSTVTIGDADSGTGGIVELDSDSFGADAQDFGENGTDATGGSAQIGIGANSTLNVTSSVYVHADGYGGNNSYGDGVGGNGTGGDALVMAFNGGATVNIAGPVIASAQGNGGSAGECSICNVTGGNGTGGNASVHAGDGANQMQLGGDVIIVATGQGGAGDAQAGVGTGGLANLGAFGGSTLTVTGTVNIDASGLGGYGFENAGGFGQGGEARIGANNGTIDLNGDAFVWAIGSGGGVNGPGAVGGNGAGGIANVYTPVGSIDVAGSLDVVAFGEGASVFGGTGGDGFGGQTFVGSDGGTIHVGTDLYMDGGALGGSGDVGGDATAKVSNPEDELQPIAVALFTGDGGAVTVDGLTLLSAYAEAGEGANGNGGIATAGEVDVVAYFGDIALNNLGIDASAYGGAGGNGGNGGNAFGGVVDVAFGFGAAAVGGTITLGSAFVLADGYGGAGGAGEGANFGGNGGTGGNGTGGNVLFVGNAAGGMLDSGAAFITARGEGGAGGAGGNGDSGTGGAGGAGGIGQGGFVQTGTVSADLAPGSGGGASYTDLTVDTSAVGGAGGDGGTGGGGDGAGGNGGAATGGRSTFLARGVLVTANSVQLLSDAIGGDGGAGSTQGIGGNATTGFIAVESKDRFGHPDQRGTLEAGSIIGLASATGGNGSTNGASIVADGSYFRILNGDATIGTLSIDLVGDTFNTTNGPSLVSVRDGTATIGDFSFTTPGELALDASNGTMSADTITLAAGTFVPDNFNPPPTAPGTYFADNFDITTGQDLITSANLVSLFGIGLTAPGLINIADVTSTNGPLALDAGTTVTAGDLSAGILVSVTAGGDIGVGTVNAAGAQAIFDSTGGAITTGAINAATFIGLNAPVGITTGNLTAGDFVFGQSNGSILTGIINAAATIDLFSTAGGIIAGDVQAGGAVDFEAAGDILFGDIDVDSMDFDAGGTVTGGDVFADSFVIGEAQGAITLGDIAAGPTLPPADEFSVGLASGTSITVGNVNGADRVGFATFGDLTAGNLSAGSLIMTLVTGDISVGSMTTTAPDGRIYMADAQMFIDAGGADDNFDPAQVLDSQPLPTSGSITINGLVSTGALQAAAGGDFTAGAITAPGINDGFTFLEGIEVSAGGTATVNGAWTADGVTLTSHDIDIANTGSINAGNIGLFSTNPNATIIGDGVNETGYHLSDAEYDRLHADGEIEVGADVALGAAPRMIFGDLSVVSADGGQEYEFATFEGDSENPGIGSMRILGEVTFTGMGTADYVSFSTGTFELDAETGLLELTGSGSSLGGTAEIAATHIHIASGSILDQLAEDPQYSGYQDDLNAPADVERPDGVIRAGSINLEFQGGAPGELYTLYVQNTGTADTPAGFVITDAVELGEDGDIGVPPNSLDVVINGQIITPGGTLTGIDVRDALVADQGGDLTPFTITSTVNGCLLTGDCSIIIVDPPFDPGFTPTPGIQDIVTLIGDDEMPPPDFGNEDFIDDNDEETEDSSRSPIEPPQPLFDTSELEESGATTGPEVGTSMRSSPSTTSKDDVDDPVSGSGNPGLMETPPNPTSGENKQ